MSKEQIKLTERTLGSISANKRASWLWFAVLLLTYFITIFFVNMSVRSEAVILIMGQPTPLRLLTGAFSSVANMCIIFLVVFYRRTGFIVALVIMLLQFPTLFASIFVQHNFTSISGICTNLMTMAAMILIYRNNVSIDKYQNRIRSQAVTDGLTGLPNRFAVNEFITDLIHRGERFAVATFDLDNFKNINNTMGHSTGDMILKELANRLKKNADDEKTGTLDLIADNGGDEFALVIRECDSPDKIYRTLASYEAVLEDKMTIDDCDYYLSSSIGFSVYPEDADNTDEILSHANTAMYEAKRSGIKILRYNKSFSNDDHLLEIERCVRYALDNDTLFFHLQPQYDISHNLRGFEALARMKGPDGNMISPADFIPAAERMGIVDQIDNAVFRKSAMFLGDLIRQTHTDISLSVNVSVKHLMRNDFLDEVRDILDSCGVPARQIEIEITESVMIDSVNKALECINELKKMGVRIAIDDFGTGYSSLSYLSEFPADMLKVDKSFIDRMNESDSSRQYVSAIISIGHVMNLDVISEGVEDDDQLDTLKEIGCDYIQGFIWGRPMEADAAAELVTKTA